MPSAAPPLFTLPVDPTKFNNSVCLPYGLTTTHIKATMDDFVRFLQYLNQQLVVKGIARLETMLMPANFSSVVGEFIGTALPRHCHTLVRNRYHNGHPDLIPVGKFADDAVQHSSQGIEVKASRYTQGWQGHNPENTWLLVFVFDGVRPRDADDGVALRPFQFTQVLGAKLTKKDWHYSGRSATNRRTITASVTQHGYRKMAANWIYRVVASP